MSNLPSPLSKTALQQGNQCQRMLWIRYNLRNASDFTYDPADQDQFEVGHIVGEAAQDLYAPEERVIINTDRGFSPDNYQAYASETAAAMADPSVECIAEAAFYTDDVIVFVDLLVRSYDEEGNFAGWSIYEVKASSIISPTQVQDALWQAHVAYECGLDIAGIYLMHPARGTTAFVEGREGAGFEVVDMWSDWLMSNYQDPSIDDAIEATKDMVSQEWPPPCDGEPGYCECCRSPYMCAHMEKCREIYEYEMGGTEPKLDYKYF